MARGKALDDEILTDSTYYILLTMVNPIHGYGIMQEIEQMSQGTMTIGPASLYTILKKLQTAQLIDLVPSDDRRKVYMLTPKGKEILKKDIERRMIMVEYGKKVLRSLNGGNENE
ncbi:PadR family transcriptional regulator [Bacillus massiliigorillae]|uniref:PadR family transcriptional regulator n=1 Tax=Bacillus massiliigorillae TaxID=1243664 RepID=UPI0003A999D5|nr:PadR family transcriptional regulator [Bacillus massiliigorillae]